MGVFFICIRRACGVECTLYCFRPLWGSFLFLFYNKRDIRPVFLKGFRPLWGSFLFVEYAAISNLNKNIVSVPSGDLFYLYLSSGSLSEKGEMLHFAVENHFPYKRGKFQTLNTPYPLILCLAVQNYAFTTSILPMP